MRAYLPFVALFFSTVASATVPADFVVDTTWDTLDLVPGDGLCADDMGMCSLRAAIQEANATGGGVVQLAPGATYDLSLAGAMEDASLSGDLDITAAIRLQGEGATVYAAGLDRAFDVRLGGALWAQDLTIAGGMVMAESGGGIRSAGDLRLTDVTVEECQVFGAGESGGGIFNDRGFVHLVRSTVRMNTAERAGGGIEAMEGTTIVAWSTLADNDTGPGPGNGGGLHLTGRGSVIVSYATVTGNSAAREGGGLWNSSTGTMEVDSSTVSGNSALGAAADDGGGGVFNDGGFLVIGDSTITGNLATMGSGSGGGVFNNNGDLTMWTTTVSANTAARAGGGVEANLGATTIIGGQLSSNSTGPTPGNGGGLHLTGAGDVLLDGVNVLSNVASAEGGGVWNSATGTMQVIGGIIGRNVAHGALGDQGGGGLFNDGGTLVVEGSRVLENVADGASGSGGGVLNNLGYVRLDGVEIARNAAQRAGGGVEANIGETWLVGVTLAANRAGAAPGNGGGLHLTGAGVVDIDRSAIRDNSATAEGGGIWNSATGAMTVTATTFRRNMAPVNMHGHNDGGSLTVNGMVIAPTP